MQNRAILDLQLVTFAPQIANGVGAKGSVLNMRGARALGFADAHSSPREGESPKAEKPGREGGAGVPLHKPFRRMRPMGSQGGSRRGKGGGISFCRWWK